jgi:2-amino-4-hydroxy-6-hydroxymethyldihydropteridine diphosphokinase
MPRSTTDCVIGLGSNLGDRREILRRAVREIATLGEVSAVSALYETEPVGPPQPRYLNAAVRLRTELEPLPLLDALLAIESRHGRARRERWGARTLDLDILWMGAGTFEANSLAVPHPRLTERPFALIPLLDVAPEAADPRSGEPFRRALERCAPGGVRALETRWTSLEPARPAGGG